MTSLGVTGRGVIRSAGIAGAAAVAILVFAAPAPAQAQMAGFGGQEQMMTQMAPLMEMMKQRMGKRRYAQLMQTFGPMMANMMDSGGGGFGGGGGGYGGGYSPAGFGGGMGGMNFGGMDMGSMMGMMGSFDWRSMQGLMGSSRRGRRARH